MMTHFERDRLRDLRNPVERYRYAIFLHGLRALLEDTPCPDFDAEVKTQDALDAVEDWAAELSEYWHQCYMDPDTDDAGIDRLLDLCAADAPQA